MKKAGFLIVLGVLLCLLYWAQNVECWDCDQSDCYFDMDCGLGCWCYKGRHEIEGTCVSK